MKKILILLVVILCSCENSYSQTYYLGYDESEKTLSYKVENCIDNINYVKDSQYRANKEAIFEMLNTVGVVSNIELIPCDQINNAVAMTKNGIRYILYDPNFLNFVNKSDIDLPSLYILAHEIGHHVNGHTIDAVAYSRGNVQNISLLENRIKELEADYFAGKMIRDLGYSYEQSAFAFAALFYGGEYMLIDDGYGQTFGSNEIEVNYSILYGKPEKTLTGSLISKSECIDILTDKYSTHPKRKKRSQAYGLAIRGASVKAFNRLKNRLWTSNDSHVLNVDCYKLQESGGAIDLLSNNECCGFDRDLIVKRYNEALISGGLEPWTKNRIYDLIDNWGK